MKKISKISTFALALILTIGVGGVGNTVLAAYGDLFRASPSIDSHISGDYFTTVYVNGLNVEISGLNLGISESDFSDIVIYRDGKPDYGSLQKEEPNLSGKVKSFTVTATENKRNTNVSIEFSPVALFEYSYTGSYYITFKYREKDYKTSTIIISLQSGGLDFSEGEPFKGDPEPESIWLTSTIVAHDWIPGEDPSDARTYTMSAVTGLRLFIMDEEKLLTDSDINNIVLYKDDQKLSAPSVSKIEINKYYGPNNVSDDVRYMDVDFDPTIAAGAGVYYATFQFRREFYRSESLICKADGTYEIDETTFSQIPAGELAPIKTEPTQPVTHETPETQGGLIATSTASNVYVNGEVVGFDAYNINGSNYFKLRDLAYILNGTEKQFEVGWDGTNNAISLTSGKAYTVAGGEMTGKGAGDKMAAETTSKILLDGKEVTFSAYNIEGNNYFKLRDVGQAFGFDVDWDGANNAIMIDTRNSDAPDGEVTPPANLNMSAVLNSYSYSDFTSTFEWEEDEDNPDWLGFCYVKLKIDGDTTGIGDVLVAGWRNNWSDDDIIQMAERVIPIWKDAWEATGSVFTGYADVGFPIDGGGLGTTTDVLLIVLNEDYEAIGHIIATLTIPAKVS